MSAQRVVITGVGTLNPLGSDYASTRQALLAGRSGIRLIEQFPTQDYPSRIAGIIESIPRVESEPPLEWGGWNRFRQILCWCAEQAWRDSGSPDVADVPRVGLVLGVGAEHLPQWEVDAAAGGSAMYRPDQQPPGLTEWLHQRLGLRGPFCTVATACASGNVALGLARSWLRQGKVDLCLAGAVDSSLTPMGVAGFGNLGALSKRNHEPQRASRPFEMSRDGFVMSEGGAVYVLESLDRARTRHARIYAEIRGYGASSDAHHMIVPSTDATSAALAIRKALRDAEIDAGEVDYINAHATSTPVGDAFEARAIQAAFGESSRTIPVSATKSMTGHLLSASSALEAAVCLAAIESQAIPPTINLDQIDPVCQELRHVAHETQEHSVKIAVSNSFGFGGSNTCLVLSRVA